MTNSNSLEPEDFLSEGEIFLQEFFSEQGIFAEYNKKIDFLKGDRKSFRVADFYIPRYDLYVEFFGLWNISDEQKARYREKKDIYDKNNIACIYLYPENLGIIEYLFDYRAMKELKDRGKKKHLFRLRYDIVSSKSKFAFLIMAALLGLMIGTIKNFNSQPRASLFLLCIYLVFFLIGAGSMYRKYRLLVNKKFHKERDQHY